MRTSIGGVLVTLLAGIDVVTVVSSTSLDVEQQTTTTPSDSSTIYKDPDDIKDPDPDYDDRPPTVGIRNFQPICPSNSSSSSSTGGGADDDDTQHGHRGCAVRERLVSAMESDYRLKVVSDAVGELDCESLELAEGASALMFRVSSTEVVEARVKSYTAWPGSLFSNNQPRKVWTGEVIEGSEYEGIPRSISMAWGDCDTESFLLEMIIPSYEGKVSAVKSIPCDVSDGRRELCLLQTLRDGEDESDEAIDDESDVVLADLPRIDSGRPGADGMDASRANSAGFSAADSTNIDASGGDEPDDIDVSGGTESGKIDDSGGTESDSVDASGAAESDNIDVPGGTESDELDDSGGTESDSIGEFSAEPVEHDDDDDDEGEATAPPTSTRRLKSQATNIKGPPLSDGSVSKGRTNHPGVLSPESDAAVSTSSYSSSPVKYYASSPSRRDRELEATRRRQQKQRRRRRLLATEVKEGVRAAHQEDPDLRAKDADLRLLNEYLLAGPEDKEAFHDQGVRRLNNNQVAMPSGRVLADSKTIDVLVLYTPNALLETNSADGPVRTDSQMETDIVAAYEGSNNALRDSITGDFEVHLNVVRIEKIQYEEGDDMADALFDMYGDVGQAAGVHELRDQYGADLVQMVGFFTSSCGIGYTMQSPSAGFEQYGYSAVHANCLPNFSHTHEIGHNLGANHDRTNTNSDHSYAFGYRYCSGTPYRTLMAYETGCVAAPRVNIFSTPNRDYEGLPQGTAADDNARAISEAATIASNFRESISEGPSPTVTSTPEPSPAPVALTTESIYPEKIADKFWKRKGCWQDSIADRAMTDGASMPAIEGVTIGMTLDNCLAYCDNKETFYKFFGVEFGNECFCWKNNDDYKRLGRLDDSDCDEPCEGEPEYTCGGFIALEVFNIKKIDLDPSTTAPNYEGCYIDTLVDLEVASIPVIDRSHAMQGSCELHCSNSGYLYFALEFGFLCRCGNALPGPEREAPADMCDLDAAHPSCDNSTTTSRCFELGAINNVFSVGENPTCSVPAL